MKTQSSAVLKKAPSAIHIDAKLTLMQRRASNALLFNAYDDLMNQKKHTIDVKTLCSLIGFEGNNDSHLKKSLQELTTIGITWNILDKKKGNSWGTSALLASASIRGGVCTYEYSSALAERFYDPKMFSLINLAVQRDITSSYTLALYENCVRFINLEYTPWISIDDFRRLMGIFGEEYYSQFKKLNAKIVKPAIKEINNVSDIIISSEFKKDGRKISEIRFSVKRNPQTSLLDLGEEDEISSLASYTRLIELGLKPKLARHYVVEYGDEYINSKLDYAEKTRKSGGITKTISGFVINAIEDDYRSEEDVEKARQAVASQAREAKAKLEDEASKLSKSIRSSERAYRVHCSEIIQTHFSALPAEQQEHHVSRFRDMLRSSVERSSFQKDSWASTLLAPQIREFWSEQVTPSPSLPDFAGFCCELGVPDISKDRERLRALEEKIG